MSSDRELLELAAKAAGKDLSRYEWHAFGFFLPAGDATHCWNPLTDDGDSLRLAVKLRIALYLSETPPADPEVGYVIPHEYGPEWCYVPGEDGEPLGETDPYAATRRAIVRAAAEIGKATQ